MRYFSLSTNVNELRIGNDSSKNIGKEIGKFVVSTMEIPWGIVKNKIGESPEKVINVTSVELSWIEDQIKKLPDFDLHKIADNYKLNEKDDNEDEESNETSDSDNGESQESEDNGEDKKDSGEQTAVNSEAQEGGGEGISPDNLISITNDTMEDKLSILYDD